jgi:ubiquitin-like protein Nedd8
MQIFLKNLTGRKTVFSVENDFSIFDFKKEVGEKEGVPEQQIRLIYKGKQLANDRNFEFYNVEPGHTINMVLQLRGG